MNKEAKRYEAFNYFKIHIKDTPKDKVEGLILGLVYSGYNVYFDYEKENLCFTGWIDEVIGNGIKEKQ
jgi:hypothetical protein